MIALALAGMMLTSQPAAPAPEPIACPDSVGPAVRCLSGRDENGAWYVAAIPSAWNRTLVVHAHGGPRTGAPEREDPLDDLDRFSMMVRAGYAWIGSTYRRGGYGIRMAAEDVDNSRRIFWREIEHPDRTVLHGQSWGGNVAAKASELYALSPEGEAQFDGVLLTNGVLAGGTRAYEFRADLRAVYQFYCSNHPAPQDTPYPVWAGLPPASGLTRAELRDRINACTGVDRAADERSPEQQQRLDDITHVIGIAPDTLVSHMNWATFLFQDLVQTRLNGANPFDNSNTIYRGSSDDQALNAGVERFQADPDAVARLAWDSDLSGLIAAPTLTVHALHDPTVAFEQEALYAETVAEAGRAHLLVQTATDEDQHSLLSEPQYVALLRALEHWIEADEPPDAGAVQALCRQADQTPGACRFISRQRTR